MEKAARRRLFYGGKYAVPRPYSDELLQFRCGLSPIDTLAQNTALVITRKSQPRLLTAPAKPRTIRQPLHHKDMPMRPLTLTLALLAAAAHGLELPHHHPPAAAWLTAEQFSAAIAQVPPDTMPLLEDTLTAP